MDILEHGKLHRLEVSTSISCRLIAISVRYYLLEIEAVSISVPIDQLFLLANKYNAVKRFF